jgi:hypothetical protein
MGKRPSEARIGSPVVRSMKDIHQTADIAKSWTASDRFTKSCSLDFSQYIDRSEIKDAEYVKLGRGFERCSSGKQCIFSRQEKI